ncbi:MAG: UDP-glucose dehydrogenase family protein [Coriobacteriia bacterium]
MSDSITVFGAGYVGLVTGVCLASDGKRVRVLDVDRHKIDSLNAGRCPFYEPGLDERMRTGLDGGTLSFGLLDDEPELDEIILVAVGTPTTTGGAADLTAVRAVIDVAVKHASPGSVLVMKSTVPPGTGTGLAAILEPLGIDYVSNPEFLREGSAVFDWYQADRVVLGGSGSSLERVRALYTDLDAPILTCDITGAEMIKYASNAFLATKISFINEIAALCDLVGANVDEVAAGIGMDKRIGSAFLKPGIGYGGSCFPKDTRALDFIAAAHGYDFHLLRSVIDVNSRQRTLPVRQMKDHFGTLAGKRIAVLGLTFKPETDDVREAPATDIIAHLLSEGADVVGYNPIPVAAPAGAELANTLDEAVAGSDAVVLATEWAEIASADWPALIASMAEGAVVFDGRNALDAHTIREAGAHYIGIGRPQGGPA